MADFVIVAKVYARLCNSFNNCEECTLNKVKSKTVVCRYWVLVEDPKTAENVILDWARKNPPITNADKFKEVFGCDPRLLAIWNSNSHIWFDDEFKEPEDGRSNEN